MAHLSEVVCSRRNREGEHTRKRDSSEGETFIYSELAVCRPTCESNLHSLLSAHGVLGMKSNPLTLCLKSHTISISQMRKLAE